MTRPRNPEKFYKKLEALGIINRKTGEPMKIYNVIQEDRHTDIEVFSFSTPQAAIQFAKKVTSTYGFHDPEPQEVEGWLYNARLSEEDDFIRVEETILRIDENPK